MYKKIKLFVASLLLVFPFSGQSQGLIYLSAVPTAWRLQNYIPNAVVLYYTGSNCAQGILELSPSAVDADKNRLYATIMAAKASQLSVYVYYTQTATQCVIQSFGFNP